MTNTLYRHAHEIKVNSKTSNYAFRTTEKIWKITTLVALFFIMKWFLKNVDENNILKCLSKVSKCV